MEPVAGKAREDSVDLRHYLSVLRRRKWALLACVLLAAAVAAGVALSRPDQYRASAELLVTSPTRIDDRSTSSQSPERVVANEVEVFEGEQVAEQVEELAGEGIPGVSVAPKDQTDILVVTATSTDPERAAEAVNVHTEAYLAIRAQTIADELEAEIAIIDVQLQRLVDELDLLREPVERIDEQIESLPPGESLNDLIIERDRLEAETLNERSALFAEITEGRNQRADLQARIRAGDTGVEVLDAASVPSEPFAPSPRRDALLGASVGLLVGLLLVLILENLDDRIRDKDDLTRLSGGLPVLGGVPVLDTPGDGGRGIPVILTSPRDPASEAFRTLVTALQFIGHDRPDERVVQITSAMPAEGKTTTAVNLASAFAESEARTLLVDGDLRRPRIQERLRLAPSPGLSTVLGGLADPSAAIVTRSPVAPLDVLPAGPVPPNPAELLRAHRYGETIQKLAEQYDVVIIDAAPVNPVTDALLVARQVTDVVMVAGTDRSRARHVTAALEALERVEAPLVGTVLNLVPADSDDYTYGYEGYAGDYDDGVGADPAPTA